MDTKSEVIDTVKDVVTEFFQFKASGGLLLILATLLAMGAENSPLNVYYDQLRGIPVAIQFGEFEIAKPLLLWINDGLMAVFFFQVGLEIKREALVGELSDPARVVLPVIAAVGGIAVPAAVYAVINWGNPEYLRGWAIPTATDIAFALGVLALLGSRVPKSLKLFLMTLAIVDDLGAIIIIAIFYTSDLSLYSLTVAIAVIGALFALNRRGVLNLTPYLLLTVVLWAAVLKSGVHATLAGVIAALFIPYRVPPGDNQTQLERLEHDLHPAVVYAILPLFAFVNTGISFDGLTLDELLHPVPLGVALGLFFGKQIGVTGFAWLAVKLGLARLPKDAGLVHVYGVSLLCGIGFTMSLFIGSLAYGQAGPNAVFDERLGILLGSLISGVLGYLVLRFFTTSGDGKEEK